MTPFLTRMLLELGRGKTATDYYRAQIEIQKYATPADVAVLKTRPVAWPDDFDQWVSWLSRSTAIGAPAARDFRPMEVAASVTCYAAEKPAPCLVVGFCGKADLLFMPLAPVLQYFSPADCDVLVVRDPLKNGFSSGILGQSRSFPEMIEKLQAAAGMSRYDEIRTFGTSSGGAASLAAGALLGATRSISFAGHMPSSGVSYSDHSAVKQFEAVLRSTRPAGRSVCVYAAGNQFDAANAQMLARLVKAELHPIEGYSDHNIVFDLHERRQLAKVFADVGLT